jgi:hypothetical protein
MHLETDSRSGREAARVVATYRMIANELKRDDTVLPSPAAIERAHAIFAVQPCVQTSRPGWLEAIDRLVARIVFDSRVQPAAVRFAGGPGNQQVTLSYECEGAEFDVQAQRIEALDQKGGASARLRIMGHVSGLAEGGPEITGLAVAACRCGEQREIVVEAQADAHGTFSMELPADEYELLIGVPGQRHVMVLPRIWVQ